jgi:hypothetical protein
MPKLISTFLICVLIYCPVFLRAQLVVSGIAKDASCGSLGEVTLNVAGGNGNYTYRMASNSCGESLPLSQTTNLFRKLSSCAYTFEVTDTDGKSGSATITVGGNYFAPLVNASIDGCSFSVTPTRGQLPYTYEISRNSGITWEASPIPNWTKMASGSYLIRVTDACNVNRLLLISVSLPPITYNTSIGYELGNNSNDSFYIYDIQGVEKPYRIGLAYNNDTIFSPTGGFSWKKLACKNL